MRRIFQQEVTYPRMQPLLFIAKRGDTTFRLSIRFTNKLFYSILHSLINILPLSFFAELDKFIDTRAEILFALCSREKLQLQYYERKVQVCVLKYSAGVIKASQSLGSIRPQPFKIMSAGSVKVEALQSSARPCIKIETY